MRWIQAGGGTTDSSCSASSGRMKLLSVHRRHVTIGAIFNRLEGETLRGGFSSPGCAVVNAQRFWKVFQKHHAGGPWLKTDGGIAAAVWLALHPERDLGLVCFHHGCRNSAAKLLGNCMGWIITPHSSQ